MPLLYTFGLRKGALVEVVNGMHFICSFKCMEFDAEWKWNRLKKGLSSIIFHYIVGFLPLSSIICDHLIWLAPDMVQLAYFEQNTVIMMNNFGWFIYIILLNIVFDHSLFFNFTFTFKWATTTTATATPYV